MAVINGDNDNNTLIGTVLDDTINGLDGNDLLSGGDGNDTMTGGLGNDVMIAGDGDDVMNGEAGNDRMILSGFGDNSVDGGQGNDRAEINLTHLGADIDVSTQFNFHVGLTVNYRITTSDSSFSASLNSIERLTIRSGHGDDRFNGNIGQDIIFGGAGNDTLGDSRFGGNDRFFGGAGDDFLTGNARNVQLYGGSGNDDLTMTYTYGPASQAVLNGGAGQDNLSLSSFSGKNQSIAFSSGDRVVQADGLTIDQIETLHWQSGSGNDKLSLTVKATGNYAWHANGGQDHAILDLSHIGGQAQFRYSGTQGNGQWTVGGEQVKLGLYGIEKLTITGNAQQNTFIGGSFENMFYGGGGADNLTGGALQDRLYGQSGADSLGGAGGDDILYGGGGNDTIAGEAGNDRLYGGAGHDQLFGDLHGGVTGDDQLFGGTGHDRLHGGLGSDDLTGGAGRDKFIFRKGDGTDRVLDFELGLDKIDLRQTRFDADDLIFTQHSGYVEITFVGDDSADGTQIQVLDLTVAELETPTNFLF